MLVKLRGVLAIVDVGVITIQIPNPMLTSVVEGEEWVMRHVEEKAKGLVRLMVEKENVPVLHKIEKERGMEWAMCVAERRMECRFRAKERMAYAEESGMPWLRCKEVVRKGRTGRSVEG